MIPCNSVNVCCGHLECSSLDLSGTRPVDFFTRFVFCASKPQQLRFVLLPLCAATGRKHCASFSQFGIDFKTCSFCYILDINMKLIWGLLYYNLHTYSSIGFRTMTWQKTYFTQIFFFLGFAGLCHSRRKGLDHSGASSNSSGAFYGSQWVRQLKFSAYASFLISWSLSKFELI